jgi:hypothetical protein
MSPLRIFLLIVALFALIAGCAKPPTTPTAEEAAKGPPLSPPKGESTSLNDSPR